MVEWLAPIALFWTVAALYFGGYQRLHIEGGGGFQQIAGLLVTFVLYLVAFFVLRMVLRGPAGTIFAVVLACLIASALVPIMAMVAFRILGVRITRTAAHH